MWKGAISFGLVMIPVKLYAATEQKDIAFRQVHREDGGRIRFRRVCSVCGNEIPYGDIAKGYELPTGEMVVLTDDDMADLPLPTTRSIEVVHFMPADQLDPILRSRSYLAEPESMGTRAYVLLRDALESSGKIALARVALRQRESLATLRTRDGLLVLETLLWPDEVRAAAFPFLDEDVQVRQQELRMASSLIDSMTADFDPAAYRDGYREALQELVEAKTEGREVVQPEAAELDSAEPSSLADALKASLAAVRDAGNGAGSGRATRHASAAKAPDTAKAPDRAKAPDAAKAPDRAKAPDAAKGRGAGTSADTGSGTAKAGTAKAGTAGRSSAKQSSGTGRPKRRAS